MLGSGAGMVILKRMADALADKDHIYAVIRSTAVNNDGAAKIGYAAPSVEGQAGVIAEAQAIAGVHPASIGYIEGHGTATNLGDPVEVTALTQVFRASTNAKQFCALGSVKSNIGHLSKAAGMAGLIKATLALEHKLIPPSLHYSAPNPQIDFANSPFFVNTSLRPWVHNAVHPRRAGVSAFGTGGTNAHAILEEAPLREASGPSRPWQLLTLSAHNTHALDEVSRNLAAYLQDERAQRDEPRALADVAYTLQMGRRHFQRRRVIVCQNRADAVAQLVALPSATAHSEPYQLGAPKIAFLFTGQGPQRVDMGKQLYQTEPVFRQWMDRCGEILLPTLGRSLIELLYEENQAKADRLLDEATYAQPALFAIEIALAELWRSWGIEPDAVIGHSMGEYAAACVAGVVSLEDGLKLIAARGRLMQTSAQAGQMMAVLGSEQIVRQILQPFAAQVSLAALNTAESLVISGHRDAVHDAAQALQAAGLKTKELKIFVASHSPLMDPILDEFAHVLRTVKLVTPKIQVVSNVTGQVADEALTTMEYWLRHMREPVRFADGMATLAGLGVDVFMEMGPAPILLGLGQDCLPHVEGRLWLPSLQPNKEDAAQVIASLGALYVRRAPVDWQGFYAHERRGRIPLPTYPFQRKICWVEPGTSLLANVAGQTVDQVVSPPELFEPTNETRAAVHHFRHQMAAMHANEQYAALTNHVRGQVAAVLGIDESERIGVRVGLFDLGLNSLLAVELRNRLQASLDYKFQSTLLFDYPTLEALTGHVADAVLPGLVNTDENTNAKSDAHSVERMRLEVKQLTDAEVDDSLSAELAALENLLT
jgi:phthiocerol/phenolphthiocerol synthesis type-I polyketide synthase E